VSTPFARDAITTDIQGIEALLRSERPCLGFPPALEAIFRQYLKSRFLDLLQQGWWALLLLYLVIGACTWAEVQALSYPPSLEGNLAVWWGIYLIEGLVVGAMLLLPRLPLLHAHFTLCATLLAVTAIVTIAIGTSSFPEPYFNQHSSYVVIFILALVHGIGMFRFLPAVGVSSGAGLLSWLVIAQFDLWLDWGMFLQYMLTANLVGALLSFMVEQRNRRSFLQGHLLRLERDQFDAVSSELARQSREDALTGLSNRRHLNEVLQSEWDRGRREARSLAVIFIDIDCFKAFNDTRGHLEGDAVLTAVGSMLKTCLRRPADLAARFGGEEFVLLLPATPLPGALAVAHKVQQALQSLAIAHPASLVADRVTASIGVAALEPTSELRSAQLLAWADEAAYAAKAAGRNCIRVAGSDESLLAEPA
jgi:diguanylate cyclase (GGDEF)-like protein